MGLTVSSFHHPEVPGLGDGGGRRIDVVTLLDSLVMPRVDITDFKISLISVCGPSTPSFRSVILVTVVGDDGENTGSQVRTVSPRVKGDPVLVKTRSLCSIGLLTVRIDGVCSNISDNVKTLLTVVGPEDEPLLWGTRRVSVSFKTVTTGVTY